MDWNIPTKEGVITLKMKDSLEDYSIKDFIEIMELDLDAFKFESEKEDAWFQYEMTLDEETGKGEDENGNPLTQEDIEFKIFSLNYQFVSKIREQIKILCKDVTDEELSRIPESVIVKEYQDRARPSLDNSSIATYFEFPQATKKEYEELNTIYKEFCESLEHPSVVVTSSDLDKKKNYEKRLAVLKRGEFIIVPVSEGVFASYVALTRLRGLLPEIPKEVKKVLDEKGISYEEYIKEIAYTDSLTPEQVLDMKKRERLVQQYALDFQNKRYKLMHFIISHLCVPVGETYSYDLAEQRAEHFKELNMGLASGIVNFFLSISMLSRTDSLKSLNQEAEKIQYQRNERSIGSYTVGELL